ncbi:retron St85 family RNA-directed DNA polymerase [Arsenophonus sp. aPb]|uniref:retron St85 family RNA-directed DNA polymerase n=1 Tax=Arsenophonus sp. aPb TaxID=3041619 RepID=UPI0024696521|nr:retron St85 family RNA-directed DNA polymerase [Arsenophonus sp. aPb]WGL99518.1 retron St85 family RNA-directed DNA polymerase [Arsenophonus sp. aPb]
MRIIKQLAQYFAINESKVMLFLVDAPNKYKIYKIPKRSSGYRIIAQPSKKLKEYQRAFLKLYHFPIHKAAMAYCEGKSIKDNALSHIHGQYLLKTDFENFFGSITPSVFWNCIENCTEKVPHFSIPERKIVEKILFWRPTKNKDGKLVLSVGAPSSPVLSNFCLYEFDRLLDSLCSERGIVYTRYADDLTFSTNTKDILYPLIPIIQELLIKLFQHALKINHSKTIFSSKAHNRHVTGITINNEGKLSLGRERKRFIKHLIHQFKYNQLDKFDIDYLKGLLSFASYIEQDFIIRLKQKYSAELIDKIYKEGS